METKNNPTVNLEQVRSKLEGKSGPTYWRSLEEVAETSEFKAWLEDEFPNRDSMLNLNRRSMLKFMGASMMLAGLAGCRAPVWPNHKIAPYVTKPEEIIPGKALKFATIYTQGGYAQGVVVESHTGRPTKLDGNPLHPANLGASSPFMMASVLGLYDPDRSRVVKSKGQPATWAEFFDAARPEVAKCVGGEGLAVLIPSTSSPTVLAQIRAIQAKMPNARFVSWEPVNRDSAFKGTALALGKPAEAIYDLGNADVVVTLDADIFLEGPQHLVIAKQWAANRSKVDSAPDSMSRMYAIESTPTLSGAVADHKMPLSVSELEKFARDLGGKFGVSSTGGAAGEAAKWVEAIYKDIQARGARSVVIPGEHASSAIHAIAAAINLTIGSQAVRYVEPVIYQAGSQSDNFATLVADMKAEKVKVLLILGGDPVFNAPGGMQFNAALAQVPFSAHLGSYYQGTAKAATWHLPESHYLECWGDGKSAEGVLSVQQPLIAPLYDTKSLLEVLVGTTSSQASDYDLVRATWKAAGILGSAFETNWRKTLNDGMLAASAPAIAGAAQNVAAAIPAVGNEESDEILFRPDPTIWDGRFANIGWLQELPKPLTTLTWDNAILVSPKKAQGLGVYDGDLISVKTNAGEVRGPALVMPGQAEDTVTVFYGYGADSDGMMSKGTGFDAFPAMEASSAAGITKGTVTKAGGHIALALTQTHHTMEARDLIRTASLEEFLHPHEGHEGGHHVGDMSNYDQAEFKNDLPQWGMAIDLNVCTGCHSCVSACVAENNIAVVGKSDVLKGREMHWIRIDRYYGPKDTRTAFDAAPKNSLDNPSTHFMPVACMHCEQAPCEPVCPVAATIHSAEGINQMVYNRCVGTRYCSNNCPYKVRRFNYFNYNDRSFTEYPDYKDLRVRLMVNNPNVTVRGRGVMEKCTFCVQRINEARINAKVAYSKGQRANPAPTEGEVVTACQAACPTGAISFGDTKDANSAVSKQKANKRNYSLLEELNTRNRLTYLHMVKNPNKELETA